MLRVRNYAPGTIKGRDAQSCGDFLRYLQTIGVADLREVSQRHH